ncbi:flp pilus-assembly TadE/G-like family protein [Jatrophihabitans fulvus]
MSRRRVALPTASLRTEQGSASVWVVAACSLVMLVATASAVRSGAVLARHRAEAAADLGALAGATRIGLGGAPCDAARVVVTRNGARLTGCRVRLAADTRSGTVVLTVTSALRLPLVGLGTVTASARAGRLPAGTS